MIRKFRRGDKVIKYKPYSTIKYCKHGGEEDEVPLGTRGIVDNIFEASSGTFSAQVNFENGLSWTLDVRELELVVKKIEPYGISKFIDSLKK